jgi:hypothetical protein
MFYFFLGGGGGIIVLYNYISLGRCVSSGSCLRLESSCISVNMVVSLVKSTHMALSVVSLLQTDFLCHSHDSESTA